MYALAKDDFKRLHIFVPDVSVTYTLCLLGIAKHVVNPNPAVVDEETLCPHCLEALDDDVTVYKVRLKNTTWVALDLDFVLGCVEALSIGDGVEIEVGQMTVREYINLDAFQGF
jgi:hypothetical protein